MQTYEEVKKFADEFIAPFAKTIDEEQRFPEEAFKKIAEAGYLKLMIPENLGGFGGTLEDHATVCRAFSQASSTVGLCYMMHNVALMCVLLRGSDELKTEVINSIKNGEFMALAYSELGTGTHFYISDIKTEFKDDYAIFNGLKSMVTSATFAKYYLVLAQSNDEDKIDNWVFTKGQDGLNFKPKTWHGLGMRGNVSCQMEIDSVKLPLKYRIGNAGDGLSQVFEIVAPFFVTGLAAIYTGLCESVLKEATEYATNRKYPDGKSLAQIETVQIHLARIYSQTFAAINATKEAARAGAAGEADALPKILAARILASESAIDTARIAMRIGGGKAYNKNGNFERFLRDSFAGQIMAPSVDVLIVWLGRALGGLDLV